MNKKQMKQIRYAEIRAYHAALDMATEALHHNGFGGIITTGILKLSATGPLTGERLVTVEVEMAIDLVSNDPPKFDVYPEEITVSIEDAEYGNTLCEYTVTSLGNGVVVD